MAVKQISVKILHDQTTHVVRVPKDVSPDDYAKRLLGLLRSPTGGPRFSPPLFVPVEGGTAGVDRFLSYETIAEILVHSQVE